MLRPGSPESGTSAGQAGVGAELRLVEGQRRQGGALGGARARARRRRGPAPRSRRARRSAGRGARRSPSPASGSGPPHMPLWSGWSRARTAISTTTRPRRLDGVGGEAGREVRGVGEHQHVGAQPLALRVQQLGEVERADLLLAFDEHLDVQRRRARRLAEGAQRGEVEQQAGLVVDDAATVEPAVAPVGRLEGRRPPVLGAAGRLHVVVGVDQHRRRAGPRAPATRRRRRGASRGRGASRRRGGRRLPAARRRARRCARPPRDRSRPPTRSGCARDRRGRRGCARSRPRGRGARRRSPSGAKPAAPPSY